MQRGLIMAGFLLVGIGVSRPWSTRLRLGRLPGDFYWRSDTVAVYVPLATSLIVSLVPGLVLWYPRR
jgi:hypothetical protein